MGETTKPMTWTCLHCGVESPIGESHSGQVGCISALRVRLSAAERGAAEAPGQPTVETLMNEFRSNLRDLGEYTAFKLLHGRVTSILSRDAAFARGVEAARHAAQLYLNGYDSGDADLDECVCEALADTIIRIRALSPAPDAGKETR